MAKLFKPSKYPWEWKAAAEAGSDYTDAINKMLMDLTSPTTTSTSTSSTTTSTGTSTISGAFGWSGGDGRVYPYLPSSSVFGFPMEDISRLHKLLQHLNLSLPDLLKTLEELRELRNPV